MPSRMAGLSKDKKRWLLAIPAADIYPIQVVARILGVPVQKVYNHIHRGKLAAYKIEDVAHVKHADLLRYMDGQRRLHKAMQAKIKAEPTSWTRSDPKADFSVPLDYASVEE